MAWGGQLELGATSFWEVYLLLLLLIVWYMCSLSGIDIALSGTVS